MAKRKDLVVWNIPVTRTLDEALEKAVRKDMHVSKSDLVREAVRQKLTAMGFITSQPVPEKEGENK